MEGPSLHILANNLQILINKKVKEVYGNAKFDKQNLVNQQIKEIYAFGKRLIIQLNDYALTIHFLMYGSFRINEERENIFPRLAIITSKNSVFFYNCSAKLFHDSNIKKQFPLELDILSNDWKENKVIKIIKNYPNETIDDILLNQEIFPGVGNIIKNEALFLSMVSPTSKISELSLKKIKEIAKQTRLFSQNFLKWHEKFELKKHLTIYRKSICPVCNSKIIRRKTGKRKRWSFICPICQNYKI